MPWTSFQSANHRLWEEWTSIHERSKFYDLEAFKEGGVRLRQYEIEEVGEVRGKRLLHLQCHFGIDTLSWARLGAKVTGADFSNRSIALARSLAEELGIPARFVVSDLYEMPDRLEGEFDVVYTSTGVLGWLPDLEGWAKVAAHFLAPGGFFYITEVHPVALAFDDDAPPGELRLRYPYFPRPEEPMKFEVHGSYADPSADMEAQVQYNWTHSLGEIVTSIAGAGLRVEFLHEWPFVQWPISFLVPASDATWRLPSEPPGELPLYFSLRASKPK